MMFFTQLSSVSNRCSAWVVAEKLLMPKAVGSNSEAYSDFRGQVVAEKQVIFRVSGWPCHDSMRGDKRTITLR